MNRKMRILALAVALLVPLALQAFAVSPLNRTNRARSYPSTYGFATTDTVTVYLLEPQFQNPTTGAVGYDTTVATQPRKTTANKFPAIFGTGYNPEAAVTQIRKFSSDNIPTGDAFTFTSAADSLGFTLRKIINMSLWHDSTDDIDVLVTIYNNSRSAGPTRWRVPAYTLLAFPVEADSIRFRCSSGAVEYYVMVW